MRTPILLITLLIGLKVFGQTDSIEKAILYNKVLAKELSQADYSTIGKKWLETTKWYTYPDLPINKNGEIQYSFVIEYQNIIKEKLFSRILEWLSITYGFVPAYLYFNADDGKIICSNSTNYNDNTSATYTYIFTVVDNKFLMEFTNIGYSVTKPGHYSGDTWIPDKVIYYTINQVFPIILKDSSEWSFYLNLIKTIDDHFKNDINTLNDYITNYDSKYSFK